MKEEKICEIIMNYNIMTDEIKQLINGIDSLHQKIFDKKYFSTIRYNERNEENFGGKSKFTTVVN